MPDEFARPVAFPIMESGIPEWVHATLSRQYASILDEPIPMTLINLLLSDGEQSLANRAPLDMPPSLHADMHAIMESVALATSP
ncbi:hypothetical protein [Novacetimonas pomaceti]|uniref:Uncharacterized protein n=1 Tax=Novacetimonas pomaceti TaxID=2021998 RepID=A0A318QIB5_9PROT|nr:hypothetical protein [Novacetimonas pomaceti]PYD77068.1 hypothetical protein CFR71_01675 [Novacetimonas pomaceti]